MFVVYESFREVFVTTLEQEKAMLYEVFELNPIRDLQDFKRVEYADPVVMIIPTLVTSD